MQTPEEFLAQLRLESVTHTTSCNHGDVIWQDWLGDSPAQTPLILLHGGFGAWTHWVANIPGLRIERPLWTLDIPCLGDSADLPEPRTPEHFARVILHGLDCLLGPDAEFELGGFSFGAMVGARLAVLAGSRCRRFTAIGAAGCGDLHVQVHLQPPPGPDTLPAEVHSILRANLRALMFSSDDSIDELAIHIHGDNLAKHRFNSRKLSLTDDFLQALPLIKADLAGVWGSRDATAGGRPAIEKRRQLFEQARPGAEFHILDGIGHWAMYEAPAVINRILLGG